MSGAPLKGVQDFTFMKKGLAKKGSLFTREMKAIVAAKNVEMTEQKGSEFVKYQNKEVFQRMLDHLLEEMERINREGKKKQETKQILQRNKQQQEQNDENSSHNQKNYDISTREQSANTNNKSTLPRPQSCTTFSSSLRLKEIQKQIQMFDFKLENEYISSKNRTQLNSPQQRNSPQGREKSKEYIDKEFLQKNKYDPQIQQQMANNDQNDENKYIVSERANQQSQIQYQYKLNANFIKIKKQQLNINTTDSLNNGSKFIHKRPSSTTFNSTKLQQNSTKDSHPQSAKNNQNYQQQNNSNANFFEGFHSTSNQNPLLKRKGSLTLNKSYRIQTGQSQKSNQYKNNQSNINIGHYESVTTLKSPVSTKLSSQSAIQSKKNSIPYLNNVPQKVNFSNLSRPQSHYLYSSPVKPLQNDEGKIQTEEQYPTSQFQDKFIKAPHPHQNHTNNQQNYPMAGQVYDDLDIKNDDINEFNYENLPFNFEEVNEDYCNQRD